MEIDIDIEKVPEIKADRNLMKIVLTNLISNAIKFTQHKPESEITIDSFNNDNADNVIFIRDNGAGFNMDYAHKLFGVFQRLHGEDEFEGTGIGLATVQRIISRHGGNVWAESEPDKGSTFYFYV